MPYPRALQALLIAEGAIKAILVLALQIKEVDPSLTIALALLCGGTILPILPWWHSKDGYRMLTLVAATLTTTDIIIAFAGIPSLFVNVTAVMGVAIDCVLFMTAAMSAQES